MAELDPNCRRSSHEWTDDQAGRQRLANIDADEGRRVHTADNTSRKNTATAALKLNAPMGTTAQGGSRVEDERDKTSRGRPHRYAIRRNRL